MAERFAADLLFIVIVLLIAALLGFLIGHYLSKERCRKKIAVLDEEIARLEKKIRTLEEDKLSLQAGARQLEEEKLSLHADVRRMDDEIASLKLTIDKLENEIRLNVSQPVARAVVLPLAKVVQDDLKVVIGIGPKIARLLINRGITTWKALSESAPSYLMEILLKDGGERFRIHNPESWPHQALLLNEGRWDELKELQDKLDQKGNVK